MKFSEMAKSAQAGIIVVVAVIITGLLYFFVYKPVDEQNHQQALKLKKIKDENAQLQPYETRLKDMDRQIEALKQQLAIQAQIVPDEKEAENFMHLMQETASSAGIEVRRYTSKNVNNKEFYSEVPFEMDIDGPYWSVLNFFEKVSKLERIINITNLQMANVRRPSDAKVKNTYEYAPGESVVANLTATTFFSHDSAPAAPAKK